MNIDQNYKKSILNIKKTKKKGNIFTKENKLYFCTRKRFNRQKEPTATLGVNYNRLLKLTKMEYENKNNDLAEYAKAVRYSASNRKNQLIHNFGAEHAKIILSTIFDEAREEICIVAKDLNNETTNSEEYKTALFNFLCRKDSTLKIMVTHPNTTGNHLLEMLAYTPAYADGRVIVKDTKGKVFQKKGTEINFTIGDKMMYRCELDIENKSATCNFGDKKTAETLYKAFNKHFNEEGNEEIRIGDLY